MGYIFLTIALVLNASANIMLKLGAGKLGPLKDPNLSLVEKIPHLLTNYVLILGLGSFALNIVFYTIALSKLKLSIAYPIMTVGGVFIITTFSALSLKESLNGIQYTAIVLITIAIGMLASQATSA